MTSSPTKDAIHRIVASIDLTLLDEHSNRDDITTLCSHAVTTQGSVATICIYPRFIPYARNYLDDNGGEDIAIATVTNFPYGEADLNLAYTETKAAVAYGADEIDVVFPYQALIDGDEDIGAALVTGCRAICGDDVALKVILETGALSDERIRKASLIAINSGADFIKTSTGKIDAGASLEASTIMLNAIHDTGGFVGFKVAGGVRTVDQAMAYLELADSIMGQEWCTADNFRIGASKLINQLVET